jgi:hypothetical protein
LLDAAAGRSVEVTESAQAEYNGELARRLDDSIWAAVDESWYLTDGKITQNWPGRTIEFWRRTRRPNLDHFRLGPRERASSEHDPNDRNRLDHRDGSDDPDGSDARAVDAPVDRSIASAP